MNPGLLLIVSAPSGAGKTSLVNALLERDARLVLSVSHTTRARRQRERHGHDYLFVDEPTFLGMVARGEFLEHAEVFGHHYGTSAAAVDAERAQDRDVVLEIDYQGARQVRDRYPEAVSVFILPPSRDALARRLETRGEDAEHVIRARLAMARSEMSSYGAYDYVVVNDDFASALADLQGIVRAERLRRAFQEPRLAKLLAELLSEP
jgi:guanylate kinase